LALERRCHWLSENKLSRRPATILFVDCEATIEEPTPDLQEHSYRLGVGCFCEYEEEAGLQVREWRDLPLDWDLWKWVDTLTQEHKKLLIVSHNADYDARVSRAFSYLPALGYKPKTAIMGSSCTLFAWEQDKTEITFLDNLNIWRASLEALGESLGVTKLEVDFAKATDEELTVYCRRDVEILVRLWQDWFAFLDAHDLGAFGITAAKQAFNAYRHRWLDVKIGIHNQETAANLEREAFKGGRTECFKIGKLPPGTYYKLDVNSLYAAMMKWYPYPAKLVKVVQNVRLPYLDHLLKDHLAIAEVLIETSHPIYVKRLAGRNCYPTGAFLTVLSTPEIEIARINGDLKGVGKVALYTPADLFSRYVSYWAPLREQYKQAEDTARSNMAKLMMNSLQGKFGQRGNKQEIIGEAPLSDVWARRWIDGESDRKCVDLCFGGVIIRQESGGESYDSFAAIPAHVSAYGRLYMWSLIELAGRENVYYMDTDSLLVSEEGKRRLHGMIHPLKLGYLKVEGTATDVEIHARKDYRFGDLRTIKGIKSDAVKLSPKLFEQWHFSTLRYAFAEGSLDGVKVSKVRKKLRYVPVAGTIEPDGEVKPPHLHLTPEALAGYLTDTAEARCWTWELDADWIAGTLSPGIALPETGPLPAFRVGQPPHALYVQASLESP